MNTRSIFGGRYSFIVLGGAVAMLSIPSAVVGLSAGFDPDRVADSAQSGLDMLSDSSLAPDDARAILVRGLNRPQSRSDLFRVTLGRDTVLVRSGLGVAVRNPAEDTRTIGESRPGSAMSRMSQTSYNLGVSRGSRGLAERMTAEAPKKTIAPMADLAAFQLTPGARGKPSRFSGRVTLDEEQSTGRAPRTFDGEGEARVDLGGSYRLTSSVAVTAGVRYTQADRDRLVPLTDGRKDDQSVYVGTRFKF